MRDHSPATLDRFNGLWDRGDEEEVPMDHFSDCQNIRYFGSGAFGSRYGIQPNQNILVPLTNVLRIYNYPTSDSSQTLLVLVEGGSIYHVVNSTTTFGPILTIPGMIDFGFVPYSGRAYINPFSTAVVNGLNIETGLVGQSVYVYKGDGSAARPTGGNPPTTPITVANGGAGHTDAGVHIFGYLYETDTGYETAPGGLVAFTTDGTHSLDFSTIANSAQLFVVKKHLVASKIITNFNGDVNGYTLYFIPGADINNNTVTTLSGVSFFDQDLLDDASHLLDNFTTIPAGVGLCVYHNRLVSWAENGNFSVARVSFVGEPEAVSQITGLINVRPDGNPLTNGFELRDVLYLTKRNRTIAYTDNGNEPVSWPDTTIDPAMGAGVHSVATVLDTGESSADYAIIGSFRGVCLFNGRYVLPELSYKIQNRWSKLD